MRRLFHFFSIFLFLIAFFLPLSGYSLLTLNSTAYALTSNCTTYNQWENLPEINFSITKDGNDNFTARITSGNNAMTRWQANVPNRDFQIHGFIGNVTYNNQLKYNIGDKVILDPNGAETTFKIVSFANGTSLTPGQSYSITFRIFTAPIPDGDTLNACAIDSGAQNINYVAPQSQQPPPDQPPPDQPPPDQVDDSDPLPPGSECNPRHMSQCPTQYRCDETILKCVLIPLVQCTNSTAENVCFTGICKDDGTCEMGLTRTACGIYDVLDKKSTGEVLKAKFVCNTAIGSFGVDAEGFIQGILKLILGIAGGILLLLIIINGYKLMVSQGDPEKIKDAREGIIAAIAGVLLIIFSLALLQLIAVDIIGIPGFR